MNNTGRNAGLTGLIDLPGFGSGVKFYAAIHKWAARIEGATRPRRGRGGGFWRTVRWMMSTGSVACSGKLSTDGWPVPDAWKGQTGTLTITVDDTRYISYPIIVTSCQHAYDPKVVGVIDIALTAELTAAPTYAGWTGTQPAAVDPSKANLELWEGTAKTIDPQGLQSNATRIIDVWGTLTDTDAAEQTLLTDAIAAAATPVTTPHNLKVRSATFNKDSVDGGTITLTFGLTDTGEDVTNPATRTMTDPESLTSEASVAQIGSSPTTPVGFVDRGVSVQELNDSKTLYVKQAGLRSTKSDIEYPGTPTDTEASNIGDEARITQVTASATPPAAPAAPVGKLVRSRTVRENDGRWIHSWDYGNSTAKDKIEYDGTVDTDDPDTLEDAERITSVTTSSTPPATPTPTQASMKLRERQSQRVQATPEKWRHTFIFARTTTAEDVVNRNTQTTTDPEGLESEATAAGINATPTTPGGFVDRGVTISELNDLNALHVKRAGLRSTKADREYPGSPTQTDADNIGDKATITQVTASATPPSAPSAPVGKLVASETVRENDSKWIHRWDYSNSTSAEKIAYDGTSVEIDASALKDEEQVTSVNTSSTPPTTPTPTTGLVLRVRRSQRIQTTPEKWKHTWMFGRRTTEQDITFPGTVSTPVIDNIGDKAKITLVTASSTPPAVPAAPVGKHVATTSEQATDAGKWIHVFEYDNSTRLESIEYEGTRVENDPSDISDEEVVTDVTTSSTPPATPTPTLANVSLRRTHSQRIQTTPEKWRHRFEFARNTVAEELQHQHGRSGAELFGQLTLHSATMTTDTNILYDIAKSWRDTYKNYTTLDRITVRKYASNKALVEVDSHEDYVLAEADTTGSGWIHRATRWYGGAVQVYVSDIYERGTGAYMAMIEPVLQLRILKHIVVSKRSSHSGTPPWNDSYHGTTNNGTFLGFGAGKLTFLGAKIKDNLNIATPRVCEVSWHLLYDSLYHYDDSGIITGWVYTTADLSAVSLGWVAASVLGWTPPGLLPAVDYSGFDDV